MVGSATRFTLFFAPWPMCWDQSVPSVVLVCDSNDNINHCFLIRELSTYINPTGSALRVSLFFAPWPTDQSVVSAFAGTNYILSLNCVSVFGQSTTNKWRRPGLARRFQTCDSTTFLAPVHALGLPTLSSPNAISRHREETSKYQVSYLLFLYLMVILILTISL